MLWYAFESKLSIPPSTLAAGASVVGAGVSGAGVSGAGVAGAGVSITAAAVGAGVVDGTGVGAGAILKLVNPW